jgi:hypothetical protein
MVADDGNDRVRELDALEDLGPDDGVDLHLLELFLGQFAGLGDDVLGDGKFADVVENAGGEKGLEFLVDEAEFLADFGAVDLDALEMVVGSLILGFDGESESLDGAQVEGGHLLGVVALDLNLVFFGFQTAEVKAVGAVDEVDDGDDEDGGLPAGDEGDGPEQAGDGGAEQVIGEGPEEGSAPGVHQRLALGEGDDDGNGNGIEDEVGYGGEGKAEGEFELGEGGQEDGVGDGGGTDGDGDRGDIKSKLVEFVGAAGLGAVEVLENGGGEGHDEGFGGRKLDDADENEQEISGHGAANAGKGDLPGGGEHGEDGEDDEAKGVRGFPIGWDLDECGEPAEDN